MNRNLLNGNLTLLLITLFLIGTANVFAKNYSQGQILTASNTEVSFFSNLKTAEPTISTIRNGETIILTGQGFGKYEMVSLSVETENQYLRQNTVLMQWNVFADSKGRFQANLPVDSLYSTSGRYIFRASGSENKTSAETVYSDLASNADLDQCANGPFSTPVQCTGSNWQNGNVGQNDGHYFEGDSIPYRMKFSGLTLASHTVVIEWDTTKNGKHAIDYITSYDRTEASPGNNPCSGVAGAHCTNPPTTFPIPIDTNVTNLGVTQVPGVFTMWGATITSVSAYTLTGTYAGDSETRISITFTASVANPVLAWGGHIADKNDWATMGGSASDINGSPYHTRLISLDGSGGNQDRSLSNVAVRLNSRIVIIKQANPESNTAFGFTTTGTGLSPFTLWDDGVDNDATPNNITFNNLLSPLGSGMFSITEDAPTNSYQLQNLVCTVGAGGTSTTSISVPARSVTITLQYGDLVTCTFTNNVVTAASVYVAGRVVNDGGSPISRTLVTIQNTNTGEIQRTLTNSFGNYRIDGLEVGNFYIVRVENRKYVFSPDTTSFTLNDAIDNLNFTGSNP